MLTAIEYVGSSNGAVWRFSCSCGKFTEKKSSLVTGGHISSCGCLSEAKRFSGSPIEEMQKIGEITAVKMAGRAGHNLMWECLCFCGKTFNAIASNLISGNTKSCGCLRRKVSADLLRTHGLYGNGAHSVWANMMRRCYDPKNPAYKNYGGRGISVCDRWHDVRNFYADMGDRPKGRSLDRTKNDMGYSPENCRWATSTEQARNMRSNVFVTYCGSTRTIAEWSEVTGIPSGRLYARKSLGLSDDELFLDKKSIRKVLAERRSLCSAEKSAPEVA